MFSIEKELRLARQSCGHACCIGVDRFVQILLQKSSCTGDRKFYWPWMRLSKG
jgi:hypothetical protein